MPDRLLILGLDGATWDVLTPLADMGVLPNFSRWMRDSALLELESTQPFITPVAWSSFLTGCEPREYGVLDYRYFDHSAGCLRLNNSTRLQRPTLLDAVSAAGGDVVSLGLPMTYPPADAVRGIVVGGLDAPSSEAALAPFPQFARRLREAGVALRLKPPWKRVPRSHQELAACVAQTIVDFRSRAAAAKIADGMVPWRLMFVQFQTLDALLHRAWHLLGIEQAAESDGPPAGNHLAATAASVAKLHEALRGLDQSIGELLELAARRGAEVTAVSDHGFGAFRGKISMPQLLAQRGLLKLTSRSQRAGHRLSRAGWKARRWLWRRWRRGTSTASLERPLEALLPIDWRSTRAVALHGDLAGLVYLNTPQRFGSGQLNSPRLVEEAREEALAALREARHEETGEPLFVDVFAVAERWGIDPLERQWPDVVGIPADGFQTRTKLDRGERLIVPDANLTGTHRLQGMWTLPQVSDFRMPRQARLPDVAPTLLTLLGITPPATMSGRALGSASGNETRRNLAADAAPATVLSAAQQAEVESRLRDLGYLD